MRGTKLTTAHTQPQSTALPVRVRTAPHACARLGVGSLSHDVGADTSALSLCPMPSAEPQCKMVVVRWALLCCCLACTQRETLTHTNTQRRLRQHTHTDAHMKTLVNEFAYFSSLCLLHILFITFWRFFAASSSSGGNSSSGGGSSGGNSGGSRDGGDNDAAPPTVAAAPHESVIRHSQKHFHTHTHRVPSVPPPPPAHLCCCLSLCSQNPTPFFDISHAPLANCCHVILGLLSFALFICFSCFYH